MTGSQPADAGDSPTAQDAATLARSASPPTVAWAAYETHRNSCSQCQTSVWRCTEGDELWATYLGTAS